MKAQDFSIENLLYIGGRKLKAIVVHPNPDVLSVNICDKCFFNSEAVDCNNIKCTAKERSDNNQVYFQAVKYTFPV